MKIIALLFLSSCLAAQTPISVANSLISGVTQPTVTSPTVTAGVIQTPITIAAGVPCTVAPTVTIFSNNGAGVNGAATATCSGGVVGTSLTVTNGGSGYTQDQVFITFGKGLWKFGDDHAHSVQTGASSPTCKTACTFACSGYATMSLAEKLGQGDGNYTSQDPGVACRTVGSGSCPVYNATTWNIASISLGTGGLLNVPHVQVTSSPDTLAAILSTNNTTPTPFVIAGVTGTMALSPSINGGSSTLTSLNQLTSVNGYAGNFPWYAMNVVAVGGVSVDFDLYYAKVTQGVSAFVQVTASGSATGTPTVAIAGCNSTDQGTPGNVVLAVTGYEAIATDNHALFAQTYFPVQSVVGAGAHHGTAFNVSGSPVPNQSNDWYATAKYALDNPAPGGSPSAFTLSHPFYSGVGWTQNQIGYMAQLRKLYPGQIHMQVADFQVGGQGFADGAWDYVLSTQDGPIWGSGSGDSYNSAVGGNSGIKGAGQIFNYDSVSVANVVDAMNSGRSYFWGNITTPSALRCGQPLAGSGVTAAPLKIVCKSLTSEATQTNLSRTFLWIREGGWIAKKTSGVNQDSYTVSGADGRYVRVMIINPNGNSYADNFAYNVGQNINNVWYNGLKNGAGGINGILWTQPFWISYGGTTGTSSSKMTR